MADGRRKKGKKAVKRTVGGVIIAAIVYLATLATSIFGGGEVASKLREAEFIDAPAKYAEENLLIMNIDSNSDKETSKIIISEDEIIYNDEVIVAEDLAMIIEENNTLKIELIDDGAKRVTYSAVYDELQRLGVIIDEK